MDRRERTIPDLVERFLDHLQQSRNYSPYTIKAYRGDIRQLCEFLDRIGHTQMVSLVDERIIYEYDDDLRGITAATRCRKMHSLSSFFRYAMKRGYTDANPVAGIELPKKKRRLPVYLNDDEISRLLQSVVTPIEKAVLTTFIYTGIRKSELIGIDLGHINWDIGVLKVRGKGGKERAIALHPQCAEAILEYLKFRPQTDSPALFANRVGKRVCPTRVQELVQGCIRRAGLEEKGYTIHTLRHTFATMLAQQGVDIATIQELMGHEDISSTAIYTHSSSRRRRNAIEGLPRFDGHALEPEDRQDLPQM